MSSNLEPPPFGDPYSYAAHHDTSQRALESTRNSTQSYNPQAYDFHNHSSNALQHDLSANSYAFNANSHFVSSDSHGKEDLRVHSAHSRDPPEISLASSSYLPTPSPAYAMYLGSRGYQRFSDAATNQKSVLSSQKSQLRPPSPSSFTGNSGSRRTTETPKSDLEDGELSEGTDHNMSGTQIPNSHQSIHHLSLGISGANPRKSVEQDIHNRDLRNSQQRNGVATRDVNWTPRSSTNTNIAKEVPSPPVQNQHKRSLKASQDAARQAVAQMQPHNIGYAQLLAEDLHPDLLKKLYPQIAFDASQRPWPNHLSSKPAMHTVQQHPLPLKLPEQQSRDYGTNVSVNESTPVVTTRSSGNRDPTSSMEGLQPQIRKADAKITETEATGKERQAQKDIESMQSSKTIVDEPATEKRLALQTKPDSRRETASSLGSGKDNITSPGVPNDTPSAAVPVIAAKPFQSSVSNSTSKPPVPKIVPKSIDRKDYIARLQAAKAGKAPPAAGSSQAPGDSTSQITPQHASSRIQDQVNTGGTPKDSLSEKNLPAKISVLPGSLVTATPPANTTAEAKKREQTELARRKIEELKNRSKAMKDTASASNEVPTPASTPAASTNQPYDKQHQSMEVQQPNQALTDPTRSPFGQAMPQHAYFQSQNNSFFLPGLFMSNSQDQQKAPTELPPAASVHTGSHNLGDTKSADIHSSGADLAQRQSFPAPAPAPAPAPEKIVPPVEQKQSPPIVVPSQATSFQASSNARKRPTAADFIEPMPSKFRRSYSHKADSSVVFEVSEDEADESETEVADVQVNGNRETETSQSGELVATRTGRTNDDASRQLPTLTESYSKAEQHNGRLNQGSQTPTKKDADGLRAREEEIERMNRRIIEMEQRRKLKQDASRAQTPGTPGRPTSLARPVDGNSNIQGAADIATQLSEAAAHVAPAIREARDASGCECTTTEGMPAEQRATSIDTSKEVQIPIEPTEDLTTSAKEQQLQHRQVEIEANLSTIDAALENLKSRLETLRKDEADLQAQIQRQHDSKRALKGELDKLLQEASPTLAASAKPNGPAPDLQLEGEGPQPGTQLPLEAIQRSGGFLAEEIAGKSSGLPEPDSLPEPETAPGRSTPEIAPSIEAPSNQSLISGELAEDVMDISGSEDEGEIAENGPGPSADAGQLGSESDSEEPYEPPASFGDSDEGAEINADAFGQQHPLTNGSLQLHDSLESAQPLPTVDNSATAEVQNAVDEEPRAAPSPDHAPSPNDLSDSDDYEPPEPMASVDLAPMTANAASSASDTSFSPLDADHKYPAKSASPDPAGAGNDEAAPEHAETTRQGPEQVRAVRSNDKHGHFIPYESPLQQFHAYRYHPDFVSRVGSGYRSLTYSHSIDARKPVCPYEIGGRCNDASCDNQHFSSMNLSDDKILVQMGDIPEGLSGAERSAFVVGLRQVIQEIRGRKVKDLQKVASEIAAYRARFLGDSSKILPL